MHTYIQPGNTHRKSTRAQRALIMAALLGSSLLAGAARAEDAATPPSSTASKAAQAVSDTWITTKVKSEILANSISQPYSVSVTTKQGVVALEGKVPTQEVADLVKSISQSVNGVRGVDTSALKIGS